jgi:hypothetical protein
MLDANTVPYTIEEQADEADGSNVYGIVDWTIVESNVETCWLVGAKRAILNSSIFRILSTFSKKSMHTDCKKKQR